MGLQLSDTLVKASKSSSTDNSRTAAAGLHTTSTASGAGANTGAGTTRPKTDAEKEADLLYEEAMEEEYAKREGGA
ncbi:hypothetical protein ACHAQH_000808 [Verticillium albo-atrum]